MRPCPWLDTSAVLVLLAMTNATPNNAAAEALAAASNGGAEIPRLPPPDPDSNLPSIRLGESIRFEEWGPIILNSDGTTRRIANWDELTDKEKEVSWRRISKRNEERRLILLEQQKLEEAKRNKDETDA